MEIPALIAAWSFASAWMLWWGAAAAIPVVIHFWNRRRQREVPWAAMEFLLAAVHKHARRLRIEQLILLAIRTLILCLLAVALAQPLLTGLAAVSAGDGGRGPQHTLLVLDATYSMACRSGQRTLFEAARTEAVELVGQARQGDGFTLLVMADPPEKRIARVAFDKADVIDQINGLQVQQCGARLSATLAAAEEIVAAARRPGGRFARQRVCFFTDLAGPTWQAALADELRPQIDRIAAHAALLVYEAGEPPAENQAISRLAAAQPFAAPGEPLLMQAEVRNFSSRDRQQRVELFVDGRSVAEQNVTAPAGGSAVALLPHRFDLPKQHLVEARISGDPLDVDNHRWSVVFCPEAIRVLCVQGQPQAADFIALALAPQTNGPAHIHPQIVSENALLELDLEKYDAIFLCNVGRFGRDEANLLYRYVRGGGGLVVVLGDQVQPQSYNEELAGQLSGRLLLPATLGDVVGGGPYGIDPLEYQHPIAEPFRGFERAGLLTTPVWRYFRLAPRAGAERVLGLTSGDPLLVAQQVGRGRSLLFATAASTASVDRAADPIVPWTALVSWPSFPPLVHEMLNFAMRGRGDRHNLLVGQPLELSTSITAGAESVTLIDPAGQSQQIPVVAGGGRVIYDAPRQSGQYRIEFAARETPVQRFAVNVDTRESDLQRIAAEQLPAPLKVGTVEAEQVVVDEQPGGRWELFRLVLATVFVLALCESTLAWWFGRAAA